MNKIITISLICFFSISIFAQDSITEDIENAISDGKYDLVISKYSNNVSDYPTEAIYYVGSAYYKNGDFEKTRELMDLAIKKDKNYADAYYMKGLTYLVSMNLNKAAQFTLKAIELDPSNSEYYASLGDIYSLQNKNKEALELYEMALKQKKVSNRAYLSIAEHYSKIGKQKEALESFYEAKKFVPKDSKSYNVVLYNIGLYEYMNKNYDKAEKSYKELLALDPDDYQTYAKLIQVYTAKDEYDKAEPLIKKLYEAHDKGLLTDNLKDMFCIDQFQWNDKQIMAFERFDEDEKTLFSKHTFYVMNDKGEEEFTIKSEYSPMTAKMGRSRYMMYLDRNGNHTLMNIGLPDGYPYQLIKKIVLQYLNEQN